MVANRLVLANRPVLSARNPRVTRLRRLSGRRSARTEAGLFVVDGPRLVLDALAAGVVLDEVYLPAGHCANEPTIALCSTVEAAGVPVFVLADDVFASVAPSEAPQPALAVGRPPIAGLDEVLATADAVLVLVDVADPGNVGTLVRVAEAAGFGGVVSCGESVEWFNPKVVRSSAGSLFRVPVVTEPAAAKVFDRLEALGVATVAAMVDAPQPYTAVDHRPPVAIVLGSEAHGLSPALAGRATHQVTIPMAGTVESLNVAMAGAILAFEVRRQRQGW